MEYPFGHLYIWTHTAHCALDQLYPGSHWSASRKAARVWIRLAETLYIPMPPSSDIQTDSDAKSSTCTSDASTVATRTDFSRGSSESLVRWVATHVDSSEPSVSVSLLGLGSGERHPYTLRTSISAFLPPDLGNLLPRGGSPAATSMKSRGLTGKGGKKKQRNWKFRSYFCANSTQARRSA